MGFVENHKETYINDFASVMEKCDEESRLLLSQHTKQFLMYRAILGRPL